MWGVGIRISKVAKTKIYNLVFCKMECTVVFNTSMEGFSQKKKKKKKVEFFQHIYFFLLHNNMFY